MIEKDHSKDNYEGRANVTLCLVCLLIFITFLGCRQTSLSLVSDLIPASVTSSINEPLIEQGLLLSLFLFISVLFRFFGKLKISFIMDVVNLIVCSTLYGIVFNPFLRDANVLSGMKIILLLAIALKKMLSLYSNTL